MSGAKICVSVSATDTPELLGMVQDAERMGGDLVEVRLDRLRSYHGLSKVARSIEKPLIATNRPLSEKGGFGGPEEDRIRVIGQAVEEGFAYADIEFSTKKLEKVIESLREKGAKIILSHHDYFQTQDLSRLRPTFARLCGFKPDIVKLVTTAQKPADTLTILDFLQQNHTITSLVCFAMGQAGVWSRVLAPFYGSSFTYASLEHGIETAPGQPSVSELRRIYNLLDLE